MKLRITVEGVRYEVEVEYLDGPSAAPAGSAPAAPPPAAAPPSPQRQVARSPDIQAGDKAIRSPIAGTITQVRVKVGDAVTVHQVVMVMEAMKMETNIAAPVAGKVKVIHAAPGQAVKHGQVLVELE